MIVDEVRTRVWSGWAPAKAVTDAIGRLCAPLIGSTVTTTLAFAPIALLPGHPGEFVRGIAISVILAINSSLLLSMTLVPAMAALLQQRPDTRRTLLGYGFSSSSMLHVYQKSLDAILRTPWWGRHPGRFVADGLVSLRLLLYQSSSFHRWIDSSSILSLRCPRAHRLRLRVIKLLPLTRPWEWMREWRERTGSLARARRPFTTTSCHDASERPFYAQGIVDLSESADAIQTTLRLQSKLSDQFPASRLLVRQLEQGPPFEAPIEVRLFGPDIAYLQELGGTLRKILSETPDVVFTRSDLEEVVPLIDLQFKGIESRLAGLSQVEISRQLYASLEGMRCGALNQGDEEIPIRVRIHREDQEDIESLAPLRLHSPRAQSLGAQHGPPLFAVGSFKLDSDISGIQHVDRRLVNEVKAYTRAGTLPSEVLDAFKERLKSSDFRLPEGYTMAFAGEEEKRDEAVDNLLADVALLVALMIACLVASFRSFRVAAMISLVVEGCPWGLGIGAQWVFGFAFGFMAILGSMGLVGVAINDAIVVVAGIRGDPAARRGDRIAIRNVVVHCTRHVFATTLTTMAGFTPLILGGGDFWPPLAVAIAGGVGGATILALYFVPCLYLIVSDATTRPYSETAIT